MEGHYDIGKKYRDQEFYKKLEKARSLMMKGYEDMIVEGVLPN